MQLLQEKTKKKLMKEKPQQPIVKTELPSLPTPPMPPKKKDCLTIGLNVHVIYVSFRNLTKTAFQFLFPSLSTLSRKTFHFYS
jgi:hypothetical protein